MSENRNPNNLSFSDLARILNIPLNHSSSFDPEWFMILPVLDKLQAAFDSKTSDGKLQGRLKTIAIKEALEEKRKGGANGIRLLTTAPLDMQGDLSELPETTSYTIHAGFSRGLRKVYTTTTRYSLASLFEPEGSSGVHPGLSKADALVAQNVEVLAESESEIYSRHISEIKLADSLIKKQKNSLSQNPLIDDDPWQQHKRYARMSSERMEELNTQKEVLVLSALTHALLLETAYPLLGKLVTVSQSSLDLLHRTLNFQLVSDANFYRKLVEPSEHIRANLSRSTVAFQTNVNIDLLKSKAYEYPRKPNDLGSYVAYALIETLKVLEARDATTPSH